jgi:hypothetical protein
MGPLKFTLIAHLALLIYFPGKSFGSELQALRVAMELMALT